MGADVRYAPALERLAALEGSWTVAAPLGLDKPNGLLNAMYARAKSDPQRSLTVLTALSLTPPSPASDLERRFLAPFLARHFGTDYPVLDYVTDRQRGELPAHVRIHEFYLQSGALLGCPRAQQDYISLNYTHVARGVAMRRPNVIVQLLARDPASDRLSFSCNPDVTLGLLDELARLGLPRPLMLAEVHPDLPFLGGEALVPEGLFDLVIEPPTRPHQLFALPRQPVGEAEYAIGFVASTLVRDGGSLQIGIGALSDALTHALVLRHTRNAEYREIVSALWPAVEQSELVCRWGGLGEFEQGLFGASEMVMDGFATLIDAGVVKRRVVDDASLMQRLADGSASDADKARVEREGQYLHGGFFLGSKNLYRWLRERTDEQRAAIAMTRISHINELYGGQEILERLQRREARFFNTCMMTTVFGAAVSDGLDDGRVVSGVGGQYNFVAMAHALAESRSILLCRAIRDGSEGTRSNIVYEYGHATIPRHLRDVVITEYGIADLRDRSDAECVAATAAIADARFAPGLLARARAAGKYAGTDVDSLRNSPDRLRACLAPFRRRGLLPDYPLGSDFTEVEQRLVRALGWLKQAARAGKAGLIWRALRDAPCRDREALVRMGLDRPTGMKERLSARLVGHALNQTLD
ncbi:acetyl-CoA hydrolase/transferase C-terminal domain-containing protein [Pseudomarimonas salicorniae]|uniref:Acetyl-CoA hydrolase n=1 Tax=Pseudomarimonas salicorniae TaxID=2933270 RepID=A0ABT0GK83_9GAMM|nr:acetyl-CoA hydrolase/transferase C-terminal domain-containing protein [Lysobacter sp. CAU 1642]MCK7594965.1 acetyl-CoA hydrolase [Lysobacter sp. CAU 1642]